MNPKHEIDLRFEEYLETNDAQALGRAFELAGPDLLRVGLAAGLDRPTAEDALQETFLVVVRRRADYGRGRGLMPWAAGIMARQSRAAVRAQRREREFVESLRAFADAENDDHALVSDEVRDELQRAIRTLPQEQQRVLQLRFVEGLPPVEIGRRLGVKPNAVSARLTRGTRCLRRTLSSGALGVIVLLLTTRTARGLDAVRDEVVAAAPRLAPVPAGGFVGGLLVPAGAVGLLAGLGALVYRVLPGPGDIGLDGVGRVAASEIDGSLLASIEAERGRAGTRRPAGVSASGYSALAGRVRNRAGAPVAGLRVHAFHDDGVLRLPDGPPETVATTDAEGRFEIPAAALEALGDPRPLLLVRGRGLAGWTDVTGAAEVEIRVGEALGGEFEVLDQAGAPVAGAHVAAFPMFEQFILPRDGAQGFDCESVDVLAYRHLFGGTTDAAGRVRIDGIPADDHGTTYGVVGVEVDGFLPESDLLLWSDFGDVRQGRLKVTRAPLESLSGTARDREGNPVEGAEIHCVLRGGVPLSDAVLATTDAQGRYTLPADWEPAFPLVFACRKAGFEQANRELEPEDLEVPEPSADFALYRGTPLVGRVLDPDGAPVAGAKVDCVTSASILETTSDADGRFVIEGAADRHTLLFARVPDDADSPLAGARGRREIHRRDEGTDLVLSPPEVRVPRVEFVLAEEGSEVAPRIARLQLSAIDVPSVDGSWRNVEIVGGRAIARRLPVGRWAVHVMSAKDATRPRNQLAVGIFDIGADTTDPLQIDLLERGTAQLHLPPDLDVDDGGIELFLTYEPTPSTPLWFGAGTRSGGTEVRLAATRTGDTTLSGIFPGTWRLSSISKGGERVVEPIEFYVPPGGRADVQLGSVPAAHLDVTCGPFPRSTRIDIQFRRGAGAPWETLVRIPLRIHRVGRVSADVPAGRFEWRALTVDRQLEDKARNVTPLRLGEITVEPGERASLRIGFDD